MSAVREATSARDLVRELDALEDHLAVEIGRPAGPGWHTAGDLLADDGAGLNRLLADISARTGGQPDVAASYLAGWYASPVISVAVAGWFLHRRVLDVARANVSLHVHQDGWLDAIAIEGPGMAVVPGDPAAGEPGVVVVADEGALRAHLVTSLLGHLSPVVAAIRARSPIGLRALWGTIADDIGFAFLTAGRHVGALDLARAEADAVLAAASPPLQALPVWFPFEHRGEPTLHLIRDTCCLAHKTTDHGYCTTCPSTSDEERCQRLCDWLDTRAAGA